MTAKPTVVVFTANSNTGVATVQHLLQQHGQQVHVRCVVRKKAVMQELQKSLADRDAEVVNADVTQPALLKHAFADHINVAFWSTPTSENRAELTKLFLEACIAYGVDYPIIISMLEADKQVTYFQQQFFEVEQICKSMQGTPVKKKALDRGKLTLQPIILRCASFYQNFFGSLAGIKAGYLYYPLGHAGGGKLPHVDLDDVGRCIANIMVQPEIYGGKTYNLIGEYQSGSFIATALAMGTSKPVTYEEVDDDTAVAAFEALGLPAWLAAGNVETLRYYRTGGGQGMASDVELLMGDKPTTFRSFAKRDVKAFL